jgi:hypothetical protein
MPINWVTDNLGICAYEDVIDVDSQENTKEKISQLLYKEDVTKIISLLDIDVNFIESSLVLIERNAFYHTLGYLYYYEECPIPSYKTIYLKSIYTKNDPWKIGLSNAFYVIKEYLSYNYKILVHCSAGIDRAPFVVASVLTLLNDLIPFKRNNYKFNTCNLGEAYKEIKKVRPQICEHYEWKWW